MRLSFFFLIAFFLSVFSACVMQEPYDALAPGVWRGQLYLDGKQRMVSRELIKTDEPIQELTEGVLFFNIEVTYPRPDSFIVHFINGDERVTPDQVTWGRNRRTGRDTLRMDFLQYDTYILCMFEERIMEGSFHMPSRGPDYEIAFVARHGRPYRFTALQKTPVTDISGKWDVVFGMDTENPWQAVGEFTQENNHLLGTFLTETGDYRFLEGTIQENKIYLSRFDGAAAYLFEAVIQDENRMLGAFRSGSHFRVVWEATRNNEAALADPMEIVGIKDPAGIPLQYQLTDGSILDLTAEPYHDKIKLIQIMGTWCPNCMDETRFLQEMMTGFSPDDIQLLAVAFERGDTATALQSMERYRQRFQIDYPIIYGGTADKAVATAMFPALDTVLAFPTLIVLDRNNQPVAVHTGFSGPATAEYIRFKSSFTNRIKALIESR